MEKTQTVNYRSNDLPEHQGTKGKDGSHWDPEPWRSGPPRAGCCPLCSSEGSQGAGLKGRVQFGWCLRTWRVDPEEQELGPLRTKSKGGSGVLAEAGHWTQLPRLACGVAAVEVLTKTASSRKSKPFLSPHLLVSLYCSLSARLRLQRRKIWPTPGPRFPKQHLQRWFEAKQSEL